MRSGFDDAWPLDIAVERLTSASKTARIWSHAVRSQVAHHDVALRP